MNSSKLQLTYTIQSSVSRTETLCGITYEIFGIISNYGDTVVHPGNAPGPCLIPASALISLAELRNGRFVVVNHPSYFGVDVPSTFNKSVIESHQIGFWYNNYYDNNRNCIRGEIWIDPSRAALVIGGQEILDRLRSGQKVEVSESNVCFSDPTPGELNGIPYDEVLLIMVPEHIAVLPEGVIGACSVEGGCGAAINMNQKLGKGGQPMTVSQTAKWLFQGLKKSLTGLGESPQRKNQILANDIWTLLWLALKSAEPAFYELSDFDPDRGLVFYYTRIILGDRYDGQTELTCWMRSYSITGGVVTLGDDAVEVMETRTYERIETVNQVNLVGAAIQVNQSGEQEAPVEDNTNNVETVNETCSCQKERNMSEAPKPTETPVVTPTEVEPTPATPASSENIGNAVGTTTSTPSTTNQAASANDWWNSVPPQVRTVLEGLAAQETQKFESLVRVAVSQGYSEALARKLSSAELVQVLERSGVQTSKPITAQLTNEAGEVKKRPTPWSASMSKATQAN